MAVSVRHEGPLELGNPEVVLELSYFFDTVGRTYDVSADGERFLMIKEDGGTSSASSPQLILVQNWLEELKHLLPTE